LVLLVVGCQPKKQTIEQPVMPRLSGYTIAVAPALNATGSADFDPNRLAEAMAVEMSQIDGVAVVPVSRVVAALASRNQGGVGSAEEVHVVGEMVGADFVMVFAVTHYEPYDPPRIGIAAELYQTGEGRILSSRADGTLTGIEDPNFRRASFRANKNGVVAQVSRVFDASQSTVLADVQSYAKKRSGGRSVYKWREFVVSQQKFFEYGCNATVRALVEALEGNSFEGNSSQGSWAP
jgi:hypothetical protein